MPEVIILPFFFATVAYIVWVLVTASQRKYRTRVMIEFHSKLLDRLGSVKDFGDFLQTDAGTALVRDLAADMAAVGSPHDRILRAIQVGAVLTCLGLGLLILSFMSPTMPTRTLQTLTTVGVIGVSLGIGFIVSAVASYRLAGTLGLLGRTEPEGTSARQTA